MRVKIERTGGFAGEEYVVAAYDTADLTPEEAEVVRTAVHELSRPGAEQEIGADLPKYRVTVGEDAGLAAQVFEVAADPSELRGPLRTLVEGPLKPE